MCSSAQASSEAQRDWLAAGMFTVPDALQRGLMTLFNITTSPQASPRDPPSPIPNVAHSYGDGSAGAGSDTVEPFTSPESRGSGDVFPVSRPSASSFGGMSLPSTMSMGSVLSGDSGLSSGVPGPLRSTSMVLPNQSPFETPVPQPQYNNNHSRKLPRHRRPDSMDAQTYLGVNLERFHDPISGLQTPEQSRRV